MLQRQCHWLQFPERTITKCIFTNVNMQNCDISGLTINGINIETLIKQYSPEAYQMFDNKPGNKPSR